MRPLPAPAQVRIARLTADLGAQRAFYGELLGLAVVAEFRDHAGYSGLVFALPGLPLHLAFEQRRGSPPPPVPDPDDLLVLYLPEENARRTLRERLLAAGHAPVAPLNPYWTRDAETFSDPDGWRIVIAARPLPVRSGTRQPGGNG